MSDFTVHRYEHPFKDEYVLAYVDNEHEYVRLYVYNAGKTEYKVYTKEGADKRLEEFKRLGYRKVTHFDSDFTPLGVPELDPESFVAGEPLPEWVRWTLLFNPIVGGALWAAKRFFK